MTMRLRRWFIGGVAVLLLAVMIGGSWWRFGARDAKPFASGTPGATRHASVRSEPAETTNSKGIATDLEQIAGDVSDAVGPVSGAMVELSRGALGASPVVVQVVRTDSTGRFQFGAHPPGRYAITTRATGRAPSVLSADLRSPTEAAKWRNIHIKLAACEADVTISVVGSDAAPLEAANVVISEPGGARAALGSTDALGVLRACTPLGTWTLAVQAPGWAVAYRTVALEDKLAETFVLEREVVARGVIVDSVSRNIVPLSELGDRCQVWAVPVAGLTSARATPPLIFGVCGTDGTYEIRGLAPGGYNLFATTRTHASDRAQPIQLSPGGDDEYAILVSPRSEIDGVLVDERGRRLAGQYIHARSASGARSRTVVTRADGSFRIELVPRGELTFAVEGRQVRSPTSWSLSTGSRLEIVVGSGQQVTGRVRSAGRQVAATVSVETSRSRYEVATAADGTFTIDDVPGRVVLTARRNAEVSPAVELDVGPGTSHDVTLELSSSLRIEGQLISRAGKPLTGLWLRGQCTGVPLVETTARSASDGRFRMSLPRRGDCTEIRFHAITGSHGRMIAETEPPAVDVPSNDAPITATLTLRDAFELRARVFEASGQPVRGAAVTVRSAIMGAESQTNSSDAAGVASFTALLPGWYSATASDTAGRQATRDIEMSADRTVDLVLQSDAMLALRVDDRDEGRWRILVAQWPSLNVVSEQELDRDAEAVLRVPPAEYLVIGQRDPSTLFSRIVRVRAGGESMVDVSLQGARSVQLELQEYWRRDIATSLICRFGPRSMIEAAAPVLFRLRPARLLSQLQLSLVGDDLLAWCAGNPATISDGFVALDRPHAAVIVAAPALRAPAYLVRKQASGHVVDRVLKSAGTLRVGDVVVSIDGRPTTGLSELGLGYALLAAPPGLHTVQIIRGGESMTATVCMESCGNGQ